MAPKVMPAYAALGVRWGGPGGRPTDAQGGLLRAARARCLWGAVEATWGPSERRPGRLVGDRKSQPLAVGIPGDRAEVVLLECPDRPLRPPRASGGGVGAPSA